MDSGGRHRCDFNGDHFGSKGEMEGPGRRWDGTPIRNEKRTGKGAGRRMAHGGTQSGEWWWHARV
jgi:hypothetical protein